MNEEAIAWVKSNVPFIIEKICGQVTFVPEIPVSIFMAGSPGAGKTEFSRRLIKALFSDPQLIARVDPDEVRLLLPQYVQGKAEEVQSAVSIAIEKIHDHLLHKKHHFLLDGTLSNEIKAISNVERSIKKGRRVFIFYIHHDPIVAWDVTKKREILEGRNIPLDAFVEEYFDSRKTAQLLKDKYGGNINLTVINRNVKMHRYNFNINVSNLDSYIQADYNRVELKKILCTS